MADQLCLVCNSFTKHAHLEVQICRACKIFYRRSEKRKRPLRCGATKCKKIPTCKKCRFEKIDRLVRGVPEEENEQTLPIVYINRSPPLLELSSNFKLLNHVRLRYRMMSLSRQTAELNELHPGFRPNNTLTDKHPLKAATITTVNYTMRLLVSSVEEFASNVFVEFAGLSKQNQWYLIKNFYYSFWLLETSMRTRTQCPHLKNFHFWSLTTYINDKSASTFVDIVPRTPTAKQNMKDMLRSFIRSDIGVAHNAVESASISRHEFFALLVLCFWNIENTTTDEFLLSLAVKYRGQALSELHELHRESGRDEVFASRIGELSGLVTVLQDLYWAMPTHLEMLRVLNIFDDNTTMYQLTRNGMPSWALGERAEARKLPSTVGDIV